MNSELQKQKQKTQEEFAYFPTTELHHMQTKDIDVTSQKYTYSAS